MSLLLKLTCVCRLVRFVTKWAELRRGQRAYCYAPMATRQIFIKKIRRFLYDGASFFQWVVETDKKPVVKGVFPLSINKFNSEGYYDPTTFEAMTMIEKEERALRAFRPIVYICSPFSGDVEGNVKAAQGYSRYAVDKGYIPIAPHLLFPQFLDDVNPKERELGLFFGNALMSKCSEVWVFGGVISAGMEAEIKRAKWKNYRLRYFNESCEEVQK